MKLELLALKWEITEQFQEYLLWKLFIVRTDKSLLTYIMTTPNAMHQVTLKLDAEIVKSILDGVTVGMTDRADAQIQWWPRLMKTSLSQSRKLQFWIELPKHM